MTARPGQVKLVQVIDLPRPRRIDMITTAHFMTLKARLLAFLRQEHQTEYKDGQR
jgi:hypothetical protein